MFIAMHSIDAESQGSLTEIIALALEAAHEQDDTAKVQSLTVIANIVALLGEEAFASAESLAEAMADNAELDALLEEVGIAPGGLSSFVPSASSPFDGEKGALFQGGSDENGGHDPDPKYTMEDVWNGGVISLEPYIHLRIAAGFGPHPRVTATPEEARQFFGFKNEAEARAAYDQLWRSLSADAEERSRQIEAGNTWIDNVLDTLRDVGEFFIAIGSGIADAAKAAWEFFFPPKLEIIASDEGTAGDEDEPVEDAPSGEESGEEENEDSEDSPEDSGGEADEAPDDENEDDSTPIEDDGTDRGAGSMPEDDGADGTTQPDPEATDNGPPPDGLEGDPLQPQEGTSMPDPSQPNAGPPPDTIVFNPLAP
ncbi:MAG: hypothetical protein AAGF76_17035, partial [Pseudomonadota bacterium]